MLLYALEPGQWAHIIELRSTDLRRLDRLGAYGLVPGSLIRPKQRRPTLILEIGETVLSVDHQVAHDILV